MLIQATAVAEKLEFGIPRQIGSDMKDFHAGYQAALLYYEDSDELAAVWQSTDNKIRFRRMKNGNWSEETVTPYGGICGIAAAYDNNGLLHFAFEEYYGREAAPGQFSPSEIIPYPTVGEDINGHPAVFWMSNVIVDNFGNVYCWARAAFAPSEDVVMVKEGTPWRSLGAPGPRGTIVFSTSGGRLALTRDKLKVHIGWRIWNRDVGIGQALGYRSISASPVVGWDGEGRAISDRLDYYDPRRFHFQPAMAMDWNDRLHILFNHLGKTSYIYQTENGWSSVEDVDPLVLSELGDRENKEYNERELTCWDLAIDKKGNVLAFYNPTHRQNDPWFLRVRTPGPNGEWGDKIPLVAGRRHYRAVATSDNKIHFIYKHNSTVMHNWVRKSVLVQRN